MLFSKKRKFKEKQICICGLPRSGSSLLFNLLANSFEDFSCSDFEESAKGRIQESGNWLTKRPLDLFEIEEINSLNSRKKELLFIITVRDVRDVLVSIHPNVPFDYFIGYEGSYFVFGEFPNYRQVFEGPGLEIMFQEISRIKNLRNFKFLIVRYEDILERLPNIHSSLQNYGFTPKRSLVEVAEETGQRGMRYQGKFQSLQSELVLCDKPIAKRNTVKWRKAINKSRITSQFYRYPKLFSFLKDYKYEEDNTWFKEFAEESNSTDFRESDSGN